MKKKGDIKQVLKKTAVAAEEADTAEQAQKVDFDTWYIVRKNAIPSHHHKEIIKADFLARKIPNMCTMQEFDSALEKYGLKLN